MKLNIKQNSAGLIILGIWMLSVSFMVHLAFAAPTCPTGSTNVGAVCLPSSGDPAGVTTNTSSDVGSITLQIINLALGFAAIFTIGAIIYGGFLYIFDAGNSKTAEKGKKVLINAVIGLVVIILSYTIITVVSNTVMKIGTS